MKLHAERTRSRRPITVLTLIGLLLLPALLGGIIVAALQNPADRLDSLSAAIVNLDEPVTLDGQLVPLGRQLAAGLVEGSDTTDSNLSWVISNESDAEQGLADGTYQAVVTIPEDFSAAATSSGQALTDGAGGAKHATISIETATDGPLADELITSQIASLASATMGHEISGATLENILLSFTDLGEQLGKAADGAQQLADGTKQAQAGARPLADGAKQMADGSDALASGANELASGAGQLASGVQQVAGGAGDLAGGASQLSGGVQSLSDGAGALAGGAQSVSNGAGALASGAADLSNGAGGVAQGAASLADALASLSGAAHELQAGAAGLGGELRASAATIEADGVVPSDLTNAAHGAAASAAGVAEGVDPLAGMLGELAQECAGVAGDASDFCGRLSGAASSLGALVEPAHTAAGLSGATAGGLDQLAVEAPASMAAGLTQAADGADQLAAGLDQLATGTDGAQAGAQSLADGGSRLAQGATALSGGANDLSAGAKQAADGASELAAGANTVAGGAAELSNGASQLADGSSQAATGAAGLQSGADALASGTTELGSAARQLADGSGQLATGLGSLTDGASELSDGLGTATGQIPTFSNGEAVSLAQVIADPVRAEGADGFAFGSTAIPLLTSVILWIGGLISFLVLRAVPIDTLTSRRPSAALAFRAFLPAALLGAGQGLLVAIVVQLVAGYEPARWWGFAASAMLIGIAFAAVNQALVAVFGGAGRWIAAVVASLALATGVISTSPAWLTAIAGALPTAPALRMLIGEGAGFAGAVTAIIVWLALSLAATTAAVARTRSNALATAQA